MAVAANAAPLDSDEVKCKKSHTSPFPTKNSYKFHNNLNQDASAPSAYDNSLDGPDGLDIGTFYRALRQLEQLRLLAIMRQQQEQEQIPMAVDDR